jgi:hypothetical protein
MAGWSASRISHPPLLWAVAAGPRPQTRIPPMHSGPHTLQPCSARGRSRLWRRVVLVAVALLLPLMALEGAVRALIATHHIPVAPAHFRDFEISWSNLERRGRVDVLILGDSVSQQGLFPPEVRDRLSSELGTPVKVFNIASASGTLGVNLAIARQLAAEGRLPRTAVLGVQPGLLRDDATLAKFAATPMGQLFTDCAMAMDLESLFSCRLGAVSALWRWRGRPATLWDSVGEEMRRTVTRGGLVLRQDGFRSGMGLTDEALLGQLPQHLNGRPEVFRMGTEARDQYLELVAFLQTHGVVVVPVAVPEAPQLLDALEARHPGWTAEWQAALHELSAASGLQITDPGGYGPWYGEGSMRNIKHLSEEGARAFTRQVLDIRAVRDPILRALGRQ